MALVCLVAALPALLRNRSRLFAVGCALAAVTMTAPVVALLVHPELIEHSHARRGFATGIAASAAVTALTLVTGLLLLPGVAGPARIRLRRVLDGTMISASAFFVFWVFVVVPDRPLLIWATGVCLNATLPLALALTTIGIVAQAALRAPRPRGRVALAAVGVSLVVCGLAGLAGTLCYGFGTFVAWSGGATAAGLLLIGSTANASYPEERDAEPTGVAIPVVAVLTIGISSLYTLAMLGSLDTVSVVVGIVDGVALVTRQTLTVYDERRANAMLAKSENYYRDLAHTCPLTGLNNRRGLKAVMDERVVGGPACVLLALDLDGFKNVNDMRGHDVGDDVLIEVGQRLKAHLRPGDVAARLGGDEFAVLMWARPPEAEHVARRLLDVISAPYEQAKGTVFLSVSIGMASCTSADSVPMFLRNADLALRYAKMRGKGRVELYDPAYDVMLRRRTTIEHELRGAIDRDELHLAFQPVVALPSVRPVGAEALLRWHHPELGQVTPDEFIPIAEEAGLIQRIGTWVLHQACHQLSRWLADGHDVWVSVNVSVRELHSPSYVTTVADVLRAHRVPAQRLVLEVTEHDVAVDMDELACRLGKLRATGVRVALDDFGAGYSSLGQLHRLPVDILKIDRGLLAAPAPGPGVSPAPLVEVAVTLGQRLGLTVIAEGVEEVVQRRLLEIAGCPYAQGVLFGRAMPAEHVEAMLAAVGRTPDHGPAASGLRSVERGSPRGGVWTEERSDEGRRREQRGRESEVDAATREDVASEARGPRERSERQGYRRAQKVGQVDSGVEMRQA